MKAIIYLPIASILLAFTAMANGDPTGVEKTKTSLMVQEWVQENLEYPSRAIEGREEGSVEVTFTIQDGVIKAWISKSASRNLDAEALETVQSFPLEKLLMIATQAEELYTIPIKFTLI